MHDEEPLNSTQQDDWKAIAQTLRLRLTRRLAEVPSMRVDELPKLVEAYRAALWFEVSAATFDNQVAVELRRSESE